MRKFLVLLLVTITTTTFGQFKLSGKVDGYSPNGNLNINIPEVHGYFEHNSISIPVAKNGSFSISLPVKSQKFAHFIYNANHHLLLLNQGKSLTIELDASGKNIKLTGGTALPENSLIQNIKLEEYPWFLQDDRYMSLDLNALNSQLLKPYLMARDRKLSVVNQSAIKPADKKAIAAELNYAAYNNLHELTEVGSENLANLNRLVGGLYAKVNIKPQVMPAGPQYYAFINNYLIELEKRSQGKSTSLFSRWENAVKYLPPPVAEQFGYQLVVRAYYKDELPQARLLTDAYLKKFPASPYAAQVRKRAAKLK